MRILENEFFVLEIKLFKRIKSGLEEQSQVWQNKFRSKSLIRGLENKGMNSGLDERIHV